MDKSSVATGYTALVMARESVLKYGVSARMASSLVKNIAMPSANSPTGVLSNSNGYVDVGGQSVASLAIVVPHPPGGSEYRDARSIGGIGGTTISGSGGDGDGALGELFLRLGMVS